MVLYKQRGKISMRVADLIINYMCKIGIKDIFTVVGGGIMFIDDALACNKEVNVICCHHEQAVAMAAVGYAKYKGIGCGMVTTGCGATNTITGVLDAWQDNTACIFISGQCKRKETIRNAEVPLRQFGVQEADIVTLVSSITKYAVMINNKEDIIYELEKATYLATSGRKGPVWLDIPLDIQSAEIDEETLRHYIPIEEVYRSSNDIEALVCLLENAKRPVFVVGQGVRLGNAIDELEVLIKKHNIPIVESRLGTDIIPTAERLNIGRIGNKGTRAGNFAVQNADLVVSLGSRLSVSSTGQQYEYFAREAKVVAVDIDPNEHKKNTIRIDKYIVSDVKYVLEKLHLKDNINFKSWADTCYNWKVKYPAVVSQYAEDSNGINVYYFVEILSKCLKEDSIIVTDTGSTMYVVPQAITTTSRKQRYITSGAQADMGFTLPAAIGASIAKNNEEVIGITGDGSLQMNIQEMQTLRTYKIPIKLFVWNNNGYLSIRNTQKKFFDNRFFGIDNTCGVSFPNLEKISNAYDILYFKIEKSDEIEAIIRKVLSINAPVICEVFCDENQQIIPEVRAVKLEDGSLKSKPIEDMYPFLSKDEMMENMIVKMID